MHDPDLPEKILQAFCAIPRHPFIDHYYLHENAETRAWTRYEWAEAVAWYEQVDRDSALVTQVDQHGRTLSSSSQPGVMARMLAALGQYVNPCVKLQRLVAPAMRQAS